MRVGIDFSGPLWTFFRQCPGKVFGVAGEGGCMPSGGEFRRARSAGVRVGCGATGSVPGRVALPAAMGVSDGLRTRLLMRRPQGKFGPEEISELVADSFLSFMI